MFKKNAKTIGNSKRSLVTLNDPKSPISERYRTIRTNIEFSSVDEEIKTLMVTSPGPAEGKSTTVANLAVVFAQQEKKVLLVDTDLRKPTVHYTFSVNNTYGLTSILSKQRKLSAAVHQTEQNNLYILPSGPIPPNPAELLGSQAMEHFLTEAKQEFDVILFDTPPVLAVTDAQILANKCDGVLLVVYSGKTEMEEAAKSKELLTAAKSKLLGTVLNHKKLQSSDYYYYYGNK